MSCENATINKNLVKIEEKLAQLDILRDMIYEQISNAQGDWRKKQAFAELLKGLLEIDKTQLAFLKEANAVVIKTEMKHLENPATGNPFLMQNANAVQNSHNLTNQEE